MLDRPYVVMDRLPGATLNELAYRRPEIIEDNMVTIAYQLGMHLAFSYVFGVKDGFQTNYVFDASTKILTRIDKESFLDMPSDAKTTLEGGDRYTQEISACEVSNLKYIPSFRSEKSRYKVMYAFRQGFLDKYADIKAKRDELLRMVLDTRQTWLKIRPAEDPEEYEDDTRHIVKAVSHLAEQKPEDVFERLMKAKAEVDTGRYKKV